MKTIKILLAYSTGCTQANFFVGMTNLRARINALSNVEVLHDWRRVVIGESENSSDAFGKVLANVNTADLVVVVYHGMEDDLVSEIVWRCELRKPIRIFVPHKGSVSNWIESCLMYYRQRRTSPFDLKATEMPDPIKYFTIDSIFASVAEWVEKRQKLEAAEQVSPEVAPT